MKKNDAHCNIQVRGGSPETRGGGKKGKHLLGNKMPSDCCWTTGKVRTRVVKGIWSKQDAEKKESRIMSVYDN